MTSLKALAADLQLSQTTVSRALNGYPEVGEKTRRRVLEAAERLNYRPNPVAQGLATGRANAIGILFSVENNMLESPIVTDLLTGISETAAERGLAIHLNPIRAGEEAAACARIIGSGAVDALVLLSPILDEPETSALAEIDFPVVAHGRPIFGQDVASLSVDNVGAFRKGAAHLAAFGHRRIALLNGEENRAYGRDRREGFLAALAAAGLETDKRLMASGQQSYAQGFAAARAMLALPERPTAFLCSSILLATGASRAIAEAGLRIPADVSLIAHDDAVAALPPDMAFADLTVLRSPVRAAGRRIAEMAIERSRGTPAADLVEVWDVPLIEGSSTAAPSA
jgi:LacI family transcriptional regulator